jgi:hypothetical protein
MMKKILAVLTMPMIIGLAYFCRGQTKNFRLQEILSDVPNNAAWEVAPLPEKNQEEVQKKLRQTFRYLGSGKQSHAFIGSDRKTVLKFFRHNDLSMLRLMKHFPSNWVWNTMQKVDPRPVFGSCILAYRELREPSGIFYVHINKTRGDLGRVTVLDNIGVAHDVDLDSTEFVLQDYCELIGARIGSQMKAGDLEGAQASVKAIFDAIEVWSRQGIHIENPAIRRNIGFSGDKVVMLDSGSLVKDERLKTPDQVQREVKKATHGLGRWIRKRHPSLYPYFEQELASRAN